MAFCKASFTIGLLSKEQYTFGSLFREHCLMWNHFFFLFWKWHFIVLLFLKFKYHSSTKISSADFIIQKKNKVQNRHIWPKLRPHRSVNSKNIHIQNHSPYLSLWILPLLKYRGWKQYGLETEYPVDWLDLVSDNTWNRCWLLSFASHNSIKDGLQRLQPSHSQVKEAHQDEARDEPLTNREKKDYPFVASVDVQPPGDFAKFSWETLI